GNAEGFDGRWLNPQEEQLAQRNILIKQHLHYHKHLHYLDFCHKYSFVVTNKQSSPDFQENCGPNTSRNPCANRP
ncbi:MAG: hypothetical protein KDJ70_13960, partial [Candidatus Competibacteraceae bacterium]|nr:hypothetical protein [Candidatus Competibacteraceae bacterium]